MPEVAMPKRKPAPSPAPDPGRKALAIQVRGTDEWKAWAERLAHFDGLPMASLVERALRRYAKEIGFNEEAPRRA